MKSVSFKKSVVNVGIRLHSKVLARSYKQLTKSKFFQRELKFLCCIMLFIQQMNLCSSDLMWIVKVW